MSFSRIFTTWDNVYDAGNENLDLEVMFLIWGIRLCIVVRKAPSEFNESRFISMAIYNEFLLSVFLNVSMLFLQSPANPDLLYIISFCHTQLTVTLLLCLIFGSKAYVVFRGVDKEDSIGKLSGATGKFLGKSCRTQGTSNQTNSISLQHGNFTEDSDGVTEEFRRLYTQLELLKEKNMRLGNRHLVAKISAMQDAANRAETQVSTIQAISSSLRLNDLSSSKTDETELAARRNEVCREVVLDVSDQEKQRPVKNVERNNSRTSLLDRTRKTESVTNKELLAETDDKINDEIVTTIAEEIDVEARNKDEGTKERCKSKSGHARTHAIVINLDDKSRFSEEVTV